MSDDNIIRNGVKDRPTLKTFTGKIVAIANGVETMNVGSIDEIYAKDTTLERQRAIIQGMFPDQNEETIEYYLNFVKDQRIFMTGVSVSHMARSPFGYWHAESAKDIISKPLRGFRRGQIPFIIGKPSMKLFYPGIVKTTLQTGDIPPVFTVTFPDLPECVFHANSLVEILTKGPVEILGHLKDRHDEGEYIVTPKNPNQYYLEAAAQGLAIIIIEVDATEFASHLTSIDVRVPEVLLEQIDNAVRSRDELSDRDDFFRTASLHYLRLLST